AALVRQIERIPTLHGSFINDVRAEAAEDLVKRCAGGLSQVYFSNSGAEANEAALKFAVLATGRKRFVYCRGGYHGKTLGALSATDGKKYREAFEPLLWNFASVAYGSLAELKAALEIPSAGFIVEPIQGESGINEHPDGYLRKAAEICAARDALIIVDEVQTGVGRTGSFLASHPEEIRYDILTLGKGLAGGIPAGATLVSERVAQRIPRSSHTSTCGGNPLAAAGILTVLRLLDGERLNHVAAIGAYFKAGLERIVGRRSPFTVKAKGRGLMIGLEVSERRDDVLKELQKRKVLAIPAGINVVRFLPAYILEQEHVDLALERIEEALSSILKVEKNVPLLNG
ncbi:MAG: aminotransferase class III-fold pyridoxal phosphate-dependent enzyme, partial [Acidobacteriota bacterium]